MNARQAPVELEFSTKYDRPHAEQYLQKHRNGLARRLSHRRDEQLARYALKLAGDPQNVLDLPCGAGRFWPVLLENQSRTLLAADNSPDMLEVAAQANPEALHRGVGLLRTSAFAVDLPDQSTDCIFCMRLLHHIGNPADRLTILREFNRVSRNTVIVSLWVDGNFKAWRRRQREARRNYVKPGDYQNRFLIPAQTIEQEFAASGFAIRGYRDFIPGYAMWRVYVLEKSATR